MPIFFRIVFVTIMMVIITRPDIETTYIYIIYAPKHSTNLCKFKKLKLCCTHKINDNYSCMHIYIKQHLEYWHCISSYMEGNTNARPSFYPHCILSVFCMYDGFKIQFNWCEANHMQTNQDKLITSFIPGTKSPKRREKVKKYFTQI